MRSDKFFFSNFFLAAIVLMLGFFSGYSYYRVEEMMKISGISNHSKLAAFADTPLISLVISLILLALVIVGYLIIRRRYKEQQFIKVALKTANLKLKESEEKFYKLFSASPAGIVLTTANGKYAEVNDAYVEMTGYSREELIGNTSVDVGLMIDVELRKKVFQEVKAKGNIKNVEIKIRHKTGRVVHFLSSIETITLRGNEYYLNVHYDITERKQAEEMLERVTNELEQKNKELEQSNKELESFSYIASHDLQEPLRKIQTFTGKILENEEEIISDRNKEHFKRILSATSRMQTLINALFSYSRVSKEGIKFTKTNLCDIIKEVKKNLYDVIEEKKATICAENLPTIYIEPTQFYQLFSNLIDNAIKYNKEGVLPLIKISAKLLENYSLRKNASPQNYYEITIADNGIGFEQLYNERIFELFSRLHARAEYPGTGIGLAICKKVVENHNGMITAEGKPGEGSAFHIFIPQVQPE